MMESYVLFFATSSADHLSVSYRTLRTWIDLFMTPKKKKKSYLLEFVWISLIQSNRSLWDKDYIVEKLANTSNSTQ